MDGDIYFSIIIQVPETDNANATLMLSVDKISIFTQFSDLQENIKVNFRSRKRKDVQIEPNKTHWSGNISITEMNRFTSISLKRGMSEHDINSIKLDMMPGFRLTWSWDDKYLEPDARYLSESSTREFVR